jgi:hypothetical protein
MKEEIADLLVGLTDARRIWGLGLCFLHLRNIKGHPWNYMGPFPFEGEEDPDLINAGKQTITELP